MKRIVRARFGELLKFDSQNNADLFVMRPRHSGRNHKVDSNDPQKNGTALMRMRLKYNNAVLFQKEA
jgi:hypothetical protein